MRVNRQLVLGGEAEHIDDLKPRRAGRVLNSHADAESAGVQFVLQALFDLGNLLGCGVLVGRRATLWQDSSNARVRTDNPWVKRCTEHERSCRHMACGSSVVNERLPFFELEELSHVGYADLHFKRGGYSVESLHALAGEFLAMLMQIDESGSDDQSCRMNDTASLITAQ